MSFKSFGEKEDERDGGSWANADFVSAAFWICNHTSYEEAHGSSQPRPKEPWCGDRICGACVTGVWVRRPHGFCKCHSHTMADDSGAWRLIGTCFPLCVFLSNFPWLRLLGRKQKKFVRLHTLEWSMTGNEIELKVRKAIKAYGTKITSQDGVSEAKSVEREGLIST